MTSLRFCLLTTFYPPFNFGGDGIDVQRTARALVARGHRVTVVHDVDAYEWLAGKRLPEQPVMQDGVEVIGLRSRLGVVSPFLTHQFGRPVMHGRKIQALLRERSCDVVVFNNVSLVGGPGLLALGGDALKMYIAHEHWLVCPTHVLWRFNREPCDKRACLKCVLAYRRPPQFWRYTGLLERHLSKVDVFIARSEFSRRKHEAFGFPKPMRVLPYFLPGTIPERAEPVTAGSPHDRPFFLSVGRLTSIKGLDDVIEAFRRYPAADLLVIGDGEEMGRLQAQARGLPNVKFLGRIANADLWPYYQHAIAALMPSRGYETFGIVVIEAFRYRTPVIARRIGPLPEVVEAATGGLLFANQDELLAAMARLQADSAYRNELADNAYRACRELWSEDVVIGRFLGFVSEGLAAQMKAILTYHSIDGSGSPISVSPETFQEHRRWLTSGRVRVVDIDAIASHPANGEDAVAITFDDGFATAKEPLLSLLLDGLPAAVFVVSGHVGGTNAWGGRAARGIPTLPLLSWTDLDELLVRGVRVEAHTRHHPALTAVAAATATFDDELLGCLEDLRARLDVRWNHLAYPYGDVDDVVSARAARYFRFGHTTEFRMMGNNERAMHQPRLDMYYFRAHGTLNAWGSPTFQRRLAWVRARRAIRARLTTGVFGRRRSQ